MADSQFKPNGVGPSTATAAKKEEDAELNLPYVYKRSVTVQALNNYSAYRQVNIGVLGRRRCNIGSSYKSTSILSSSKGEIEAYFPALIGIAANNSEFITRVKDYLSNIQVTVDDKVVFDNSIRFKTKADYLEFKKKEDRIADAYEKANKRDLKSLKDAIKEKIEAINELESTVYLIGTPTKLEDYILYRHVLLYNEVAKDMTIANYDRNIRFYLVDEARENKRLQANIREMKKAMASFVALGNSEDKFNAVFVRFCTVNHYNLADYMLKDELEKNVLLSEFVKNEPAKFNEICSDNNLMMAAFIERLIARGELVKSEHNQQISTADGTYIGKNLNDAVAYFENPENKAVLDAYQSKLSVTSY